MTTSVIHVRDLPASTGAVYIGREHSGRGRGPSFKRSPWANPWNWKVEGRDRAIALYARWIAGDAEAASLLPPGRWHKPTPQQIRNELRGQVLACWCDEPLPCHGHVLAAIADEIETPGGEVPTGSIPSDERMIDHDRDRDDMAGHPRRQVDSATWREGRRVPPARHL